jgi:hypothetical protein
VQVVRRIGLLAHHRQEVNAGTAADPAARREDEPPSSVPPAAMGNEAADGAGVPLGFSSREPGSRAVSAPRGSMSSSEETTQP